MRTAYRVLREGTEIVAVECVLMASGFWHRIFGLVAGGFRGAEGLLLAPCNGIHTFFLKEPIDVVVLDKGGKVLRCHTNLRPYRVVWPSAKGRSVLELKAGTLEHAGISPGMRILFQAADTAD